MHAPQTDVILLLDGRELARKTLPPGQYIIGRGSDADIHAATPLLSRKHARLTIDDAQITIEDLGSANGTFVSGEPVSGATPVLPHDTVRLGDAILEVRAAEGSAVRRVLPEEFLNGHRLAPGKAFARGGMGAIHEAVESTTKRTVAMKVMLDGAGEEDVLRFIEEAQVTAQLEHPNIVPVHELGLGADDQLYYTMKLVRGITLKKVLDLMAKGTEATLRKYPLPALLTIFQKACDAIAFAHAKGVIHRDLKPENIMLGDFGEVLVMDWGIAKIVGQNDARFAAARPTVTAPGQTMTGVVMGTPHYMAPEQANGEIERLGPRADIYSLGAILFQILFLRGSVSGGTPEEILAKVRAGQLAWPDAATLRILQKKLTHLPGGRAPDSLVAVCRKALALELANRYARVEDFQADIEAYQGGFSTSAESTNPLKQLLLLVRRRKIESAAAALVLASTLGFGTHAVIEGRRAESALEDLKRTAPALRQLAESEAAFHRFDSALEKLDVAISLDPAFLPSHWRRACLLMGAERFPEAADALRFAKKKDPAGAQFAGILPHVEKIAAGATDAERFSPDLIAPVFNFLNAVGANGEATRLSRHLRVSAEKRIALVRERVDAWLGKGHAASVSITSGGYLELNLKTARPGAIEPLRGMPIDVFQASNCKLTSIDALQGMRLMKLILDSNQIADLSPLRGMTLSDLNLSSTRVGDIAVLAGMPLKFLNLSNCEVLDCAPLTGAPLQELIWSGCKAVNLAPLAGLPLRRLTVSGCPSRDYRPLAALPLEYLNLSGSKLNDLAQLAGSPVKELSVSSCGSLKDFAPLLKCSSLERLHTNAPRELLEPLRAHPALAFINHKDAGFIPVADFWNAATAGKE